MQTPISGDHSNTKGAELPDKLRNFILNLCFHVAARVMRSVGPGPLVFVYLNGRFFLQPLAVPHGTPPPDFPFEPVPPPQPPTYH